MNQTPLQIADETKQYEQNPITQSPIFRSNHQATTHVKTFHFHMINKLPTGNIPLKQEKPNLGGSKS